jgi:hypothetical protein
MTPRQVEQMAEQIWGRPAAAGWQRGRELGRRVIWYRVELPGGSLLGGLIEPRGDEDWIARAGLRLDSARETVRERYAARRPAEALVAVRRGLLTRTRQLWYAAGQACDWLETCERPMLMEGLR